MTRIPLYLLFAGISLASLAPSTAQAAFPLASTDVEVAITGPVAELTIEQTFRNTYDDFIEATYVFPLQQDAAVDAAIMRIGDREIRAQIHRRDEAREIYEEARESGQSASLTEQERENIFTQSVANIPPGEEIHVVLHVVQPVHYEDGHYRFDFPLVVGPRFIPAGMDLDAAAAVSPPVLPTTAADDQGIQNRVNLSVGIDLGLPLASVKSLSHPETDIRLDRKGAEVWLRGARADRDFVLEITPDVDEPEVAFLAQDGHFTLLFEPQPDPTPDEVVPRELVFLLDTSCSMSGFPMDASKQVMREALRGLLPTDSFQVIRFDDAVGQLSPTPLPATPENIRAGLAYVDALSGGGGTYMDAGIRAALDYPVSQAPGRRGRRQRIVTLLTDGYIGNDTQILGLIADHLGASRMFSFGIGRSVNRYLLDRAAQLGRGSAVWVLDPSTAEQQVHDFYARIARPVLSDIEIDWGDMAVQDVYPTALPDLYAGQPLRVYGRYTGDPGEITVRGRLGSRETTEKVKLQVLDDGAAIPSAWARAKVADLSLDLLWGPDGSVEEEITRTALQYQILTAFTSFVAVERKVRNPEGEPITIAQPLEIPAGVDFTAATGVEISRKAMRPGDPLLTVAAPADARGVLAIFPWGEVASLRWDPARNRWYHRFLVPREVEDGDYEVDLLITGADGKIQRRSQRLTVDAAAPELDAEAIWTEDGTLVRVYLEEPLRGLHIYPVGHPEDRIRVDLRRPEYASQTEIEVLLPEFWGEVQIDAKDHALNTFSTILSIESDGGAE